MHFSQSTYLLTKGQRMDSVRSKKKVGDFKGKIIKTRLRLTMAVPEGAIMAPLLNKADAPIRHLVTPLIIAPAPDRVVYAYVHLTSSLNNACKILSPEFKGL